MYHKVDLHNSSTNKVIDHYQARYPLNLPLYSAPDQTVMIYYVLLHGLLSVCCTLLYAQ